MDLRFALFVLDCLLLGPRPHGRGGFKDRVGLIEILIQQGPRPHGRGGFKEVDTQNKNPSRLVPAHTGGVDLRTETAKRTWRKNVPAHTGGVDLRKVLVVSSLSSMLVPAHTGGVDLRRLLSVPGKYHFRPRPHGRGGFKVFCTRRVLIII